jgi:hypothetical protein
MKHGSKLLSLHSGMVLAQSENRFATRALRHPGVAVADGRVKEFDEAATVRSSSAGMAAGSAWSRARIDAGGGTIASLSA